MSSDRDQGIVDLISSVDDSTTSTLRLFTRNVNNLGGFYVVGAWASVVAQQFVKSTTVLKNWGTPSKPLMCVQINEALGRDVIREALLHLGVAVEVYDRPSGGGPYSCKKRGSPGNASAFDDVLFAVGDVEVQLMSFGAVWLVAASSASATNTFEVGFACANSTLRVISVAQFMDTEQLVHLSALLTQCNLKEVYLPASGASTSSPAFGPGLLMGEVRKTLRRLLEAANISVVEIPSKLFISSDATRRLQSLLRVQESTLMLDEVPNALPPINALLQHSGMLLDDANLRGFTLLRTHPEEFLRLDNAAVVALNIIAPAAEAGRGKLPISIFGWLNQCASGMGSRLMRQWLLQPLRSASAIEERLDMIDIFVQTADVRDSIRECLKGCIDLDRLNKKLQRGSCSLREVYSLLGFVATLPTVINILGSGAAHARCFGHIKENYVDFLAEQCEEMENLVILIEASVESVYSSARMKPEFDDDLMELDRARSELLADVEKEFKSVLNKHEWTEKTLKLEHHASYGHVLRVSRKDDREVRENDKFQTINTSKDGVRFTTEKLSACNHQLKAITAEYERRTISLQKQLVETVATYLPILDAVKEKLAELDVFSTVATIVRQSRHPMCRPTIANAKCNEIHFVNIRHPLVEIRQADYVPNSVRMDDECNALIITGPNMGGKSTLMRSVGIGVVLAQAGFFVPAEAATVSTRDAVLCRVGASDHMAQGVSTFMVEMLESSSILASATQSSFVIIDELGRGTSTFDGFGLAWSIAQDIACNLRASLLFSTHFHEMTELAEEFPNISNVHVGAETQNLGADKGTQLRFTYKLEPGACERSFGILVAELARMPEEIVEEAKRKAAEMESFGASSATAASDGKIRNVLSALSNEALSRLTLYAQRIHSITGQSSNDESARAEAAEQLSALRSEVLQDPHLQSVLTVHRN